MLNGLHLCCCWWYKTGKPGQNKNYDWIPGSGGSFLACQDLGRVFDGSVHQTVRWSTRSLRSPQTLMDAIAGGTLVYSLIRRTLSGTYRVCTEFDSMETCTQSLAQDGHPLMWWPWSITFITMALESECSHCMQLTPHSIMIHIQLLCAQIKYLSSNVNCITQNNSTLFSIVCWSLFYFQHYLCAPVCVCVCVYNSYNFQLHKNKSLSMSSKCNYY